MVKSRITHKRKKKQISYNLFLFASFKIKKKYQLHWDSFRLHEPPIVAKDIRIVGRANGYIAIDKPAGITVHPSGRYRYNTVVEIMANKLGVDKIYLGNRLDRMVSGLMILGTDAENARKLEQEMSARKVQKKYICRVLGTFPEGVVICDKPIRTVAHKLGLNCVDIEGGKESLTEFEKIFSDEHTSVVICRPKTGRTHQIRVHLQYLGFPIVNDPLYCNPNIWGAKLGYLGQLPEQVDEKKLEHVDPGELKFDVGGHDIVDLSKQQANTNSDLLQPLIDRLLNEIRAGSMDGTAGLNSATDNENIRDTGHVGESSSDLDTKTNDQPTTTFCPECHQMEYPDPAISDLGIWLHAMSYSGHNWSFETEIPDWAESSFIPKLPKQLLDILSHR
ncbi:hypothetical protein AX774_g6480 [Zancudomyces culisetae]|uniref:Pseudouridine synthase n=1 Tax=Zancudomyces culisetae TaxID=1213189 RepID=A0A1R1PGJ0_ZANCU|nr:hypothetical protein AX774_g6480 [Zancudomyces culisetae]|eukprot:OMH80094.1 hypothetical protein AX774_g6480 [Zancudomyces culisetae]